MLRLISPLLLCLALAAPARADGPAAPASSPAPSPRVEAVSDQFELVGRLRPEGLVLWLDRSADNAPVRDGELVLIDAGFRPEHGDYLLGDAALLPTLQQAGEHSLTFTLSLPAAEGQAEESDLLLGDLDVHEDHALASGPISTALLAGLALAAALLLGLGLAWRRRQQRQGGAA